LNHNRVITAEDDWPPLWCESKQENVRLGQATRESGGWVHIVLRIMMMVAVIVFLFTTAAPALTWLEVSINKTSSLVLRGARMPHP
jgi:hypothetical protein